MCLRKVNKSLLWVITFILCICLGIVYSKDTVMAASGVKIGYGDTTTYVCYSMATGNYIRTAFGPGNHTECTDDGYPYTILKYIDDDYAYCVHWKLVYEDQNNNYVKDNNWLINSKNAIVSGYLIDLIQNKNSKGYDKYQAYEMAGAALNTFFAKNGDGGSYSFDNNNEINGYLNEALNYYSTVKTTKSLPSVTIKTSDNVLGYKAISSTKGRYFSGKITVSGLVANYGGSSDYVSYVITAATDNGVNASICTDANGAHCEDGAVTISNMNGDYSFYIYIDSSKVSFGDAITISVRGSNSSKYYSSILYEDTAHDDAQKLMTISDFTVSRSVNKAATLTIPDLENHRITIYKVDENGARLNGANLELWMDGIDSKTGKKLVSNSNGSAYMTYSTGNVAADDADFFAHDYYIVETNAPDGFVFASSTTPFYLKGTLNNNSANKDLCYKNDSTDVVDFEYCNYSNYKYMCKTSDGFKEPIDGNCSFEEVGEGEEIITYDYDKVCYKIDSGTSVSDDYCNSVEMYTRVQYSNGNIIVFQTNARNVINISKTDITGEKEVAGAHLKICTKANYEKDGINCEVAKTIDGVEMSFISADTYHSIYGIPKGDYYIVETISPSGYVKGSGATMFSIDGSGKVVTNNKEITNDEFKNGKVITINNKLSKISVSKQDIATSKELPGATISICRTYVDDDGNIKLLTNQYTGDCIEAILADGTAATWISTSTPKVIEGLSSGTYYLVERIAPTDYSLSESILFTLNDDGTLIDSDGKGVDGNKLVMYDEPIINVETGGLNTYIVIGILVCTITFGIFGMARFKNNINNVI